MSNSQTALNNINFIGNLKDLQMTQLHDLKTGSNHSSDNEFY